MSSVAYAELHAHSAYSFLDGASLPEELVERSVELGLSALALTDHNGFPGIIQLSEAARNVGLPVVVGTELAVGTAEPRVGSPDPAGDHVVILARSPRGYTALSRAVGGAQLASGKKGEAQYALPELAGCAQDWMVLTGCRKGSVRRALESEPVWAEDAAGRALTELQDLFGRDNVAVELTATGEPLDAERNDVLVRVARRAGAPAIVTGNVHYARPQDRKIADILAATRAGCALADMDGYLPAAGSYLRSGEQMLALHGGRQRNIEAAAALAQDCAFDLALVAPSLPPFPVPAGHTETTWLAELVRRGATARYGTRDANPTAWAQIDHEMTVIKQLKFPGYFLIVHEIVEFCAARNIWCQGRGSAANSAVCYALGITAVDAVRHKMLFERFLSPGRSGPPDIDLDIESGRREEVIQHVYQRYGRMCAAQVANAITYRPRSAIRDVAKALGYSSGQAEGWSGSIEHRAPRQRGRVPDPTKEAHAAAEKALPRSATFTARWDTSHVPHDVAVLASHLQRLPRHLGIHSSGMVIADRPVIDVCPVEWATMPGRTVLQWDKDDCAAAGFVKFDLLGLGMLTALRLAFTELGARGLRALDGSELGLHNLPQEDPRVYALLQAADTVGVFQVESRAQMATLPRLRPKTFYDIVIEVALIRPGPIQGNSVNPYIRRRRGEEPVTYLHPSLKPALEKTLGIPLFQEQLMQIAIDAAGFSPAAADRLRKAMGSKRSLEKMEALRMDLMAGMKKRGISYDAAEHIYEKLKAFAEFGFPESHAFSFTYLVYASAWLKVHHPEAFYLGILNAQPMGFYSPQTLVADARTHGVSVLPPDVTVSAAQASLEETAPRPLRPHPLVDACPTRAIRLGLNTVKGLGEAAERIVAARATPFTDTADLARRAGLSEHDLEALATAGALRSLGMSRRRGVWLAHTLGQKPERTGRYYQPVLPGTEPVGKAPALATMTEAEEVAADLVSTGLSTGRYPTEFLRPALTKRGVVTVADTVSVEERTRIRVAGIVTHRQRPMTANGITFLSLEDETGLLNVLCSPALWERHKTVACTAQALVVRGVVEKSDGAVVFVADGLEALPLRLPLKSRDFR